MAFSRRQRAARVGRLRQRGAAMGCRCREARRSAAAGTYRVRERPDGGIPGDHDGQRGRGRQRCPLGSQTRRSAWNAPARRGRAPGPAASVAAATHGRRLAWGRTRPARPSRRWDPGQAPGDCGPRRRSARRGVRPSPDGGALRPRSARNSRRPDRRFHVWIGRDGRRAGRPFRALPYSNSLAFTPDGRSLFTARLRVSAQVEPRQRPAKRPAYARKRDRSGLRRARARRDDGRGADDGTVVL